MCTQCSGICRVSIRGERKRGEGLDDVGMDGRDCLAVMHVGGREIVGVDGGGEELVRGGGSGVRGRFR